jgi:hypothetical protein
MKKSFGIIVMTLFYLFASCGVYISMHYCGGKLKSLSFLSYRTDSGCCCGMKEKRKDCCKQKAIHIKIKDTQKSVDTLKPPHSLEKFIYASIFSLNLNYSFSILKTPKSFYHKPPPLISSEELYLSNGVLLI